MAVFSVWVVPLGVANALVFSAIMRIRNNDLQVIACLLIGAALLAADLWVLRWWTRRQQQLIEQRIPMRAGGWVAAASIVAVLAFGVAAVLPVLLPGEGTGLQIPRGVTRSVDLLGQPRSFVLARLGPPKGISITANSSAWVYHDANEQPVEGAVVLSGDKVIAVAPESAFLLPSSVEPGVPSLGDPLEVFLRAYGAPVERVEGALTMELKFANGARVSVRNDIAVGVTREE